MSAFRITLELGLYKLQCSVLCKCTKQLTAFFEITPAVSSTREAFLDVASAPPWSILLALLVVISSLREDTTFCTTCLKDKISKY